MKWESFGKERNGGEMWFGTNHEDKPIVIIQRTDAFYIMSLRRGDSHIGPYKTFDEAAAIAALL